MGTHRPVPFHGRPLRLYGDHPQSDIGGRGHTPDNHHDQVCRSMSPSGSSQADSAGEALDDVVSIGHGPDRGPVDVSVRTVCSQRRGLPERRIKADERHALTEARS